MKKFPKFCDPNSEPFDLLNYLEWRATNYPRSPRVSRSLEKRDSRLRILPFAGLNVLIPA